MAKTTTKAAPGKNAAGQRQNVPAKQEAKSQLPAGYNYGAMAGDGADDIGAEDFIIPFVRIIQQNSPQLTRNHEKFIKGAKAGMFFNVSTNKLYGDPAEEDEGFPFSLYLAHKDRYYGEFVPRDNGGGFVGIRTPEDPLVEQLRGKQGKFGKLINEEAGTEIVETYAAYSLIPDGNNPPEQVVLPFASTGITPFKQFLMQLNPLLRRGVPMYAVRVRICTRSRTNDEGTFYVPVLQLDGTEPEDYLLAPDDPLVQAGREFRRAVLTGEKKGDFAAGAETSADTDEL